MALCQVGHVAFIPTGKWQIWLEIKHYSPNIVPHTLRRPSPSAPLLEPTFRPPGSLQSQHPFPLLVSVRRSWHSACDKLRARSSVETAQLCPEQTKEASQIALESPYRAILFDGDKLLVNKDELVSGVVLIYVVIDLAQCLITFFLWVGNFPQVTPFSWRFHISWDTVLYVKYECWYRNKPFRNLGGMASCRPYPYMSHSLSELVSAYLF